MKKIILDTNFLMAVLNLKLDIFEEIKRISNFNYKLYIYDKTIEELKKIIETQSLKQRKAAKFALNFIEKKEIEIIDSDSDTYVDDLILNNLDQDTIVATNDIELKKKILQKQSSVIIIRQKKFLQLIDKKA